MNPIITNGLTNRAMRNSICPRLLSLLTLLLCAGTLRAEPFTLRILTYNIHHGEGTDKKLDLDRIASVINNHRPDFACLQEVDQNMPRTQNLNFPKLIGDKTGLEWVFEPNLTQGEGNYGNATFSKTGVEDHVNPPLPNPNNAEPRGCLIARYVRDGRNIYILNTHLGLKPDERKAQCAALVNFIGRLKGTKSRPDLLILAGDLNETTDGEGVKQLLTELTDTLPTGQPAATIGKGDGAKRIDFILTTPGTKVKQAKVIDTSVTQVASDHLPYMVDLEIDFPPMPTPTTGASPTPTVTPTK